MKIAMTSLIKQLQRPDGLNDTNAIHWFEAAAEMICNRVELVVGGERHRLTEVEFYYFHDNVHPDSFAHCDPLQLEFGKWYFHRIDGSYKGGSFKGLDISFGDGVAYGGVLIRGLQKPDGSLVDGPCLCVNHILEKAKTPNVAFLDSLLNGRHVWDSSSPMYLEESEQLEAKELYRSARVGLTLKRSQPGSNMPYYIARPYRFLTEPRRIKKGKTLLILSQISNGSDATSIHNLTGSPRPTIQKHIDSFAEGQKLKDFRSFQKKELKSADLARLHGAFQALAERRALVAPNAG